jgi:hypothetical protein
VGKLIQVGGKLAVLGVDMDNHLGPWHIMRPGGFSVPAIGDGGKSIGSTLCKRHAITNGYASDFAPSHQQLCPACHEQL